MSTPFSSDPQPPTATIKMIEELASDISFALVAVVEPRASDHAQYIQEWLDAGCQGEMTYLANYLDQRLDPQVLLPGMKSMICVADRYPWSANAPSASLDETGPGDAKVGRIARYAWGDDYHKVMKKRLHRLADRLRERWPQYEYRSAVDTAPILEREHAQRAGLGWVGKHTLLIHPTLGSWLLLGQIVTTLPIETAGIKPTEDHCGTCTRCIDACPTQCIEPYKLDASRCVSYLTIEHRGMVQPDLHEGMGQWLAGCDICQEVCPYNDTERLDRVSTSNKSDDPAFHPRYALRPPAPSISLLDVLGWSTQSRRLAFSKSALKRIKLDMLKRNALIAAGNYFAHCDDPELREKVESLAKDAAETQMVRDTARQVLSRLCGDDASGAGDD